MDGVLGASVSSGHTQLGDQAGIPSEVADILWGGTVKAQPLGDLASTEPHLQAPVLYFGQENQHWQDGCSREAWDRAFQAVTQLCKISA